MTHTVLRTLVYQRQLYINYLPSLLKRLILVLIKHTGSY